MLPGGRWALGSGTVDPTPGSEKGGQDSPAGRGTSSTPQSQSPHKGLLCPAGGQCGRPQRRPGPRRSWAGGRRSLGGGPAVPPLRRSCQPHGRRGRPTFGRCRRWPRHCPLSLAGAGLPARRPPAAASCSRNAANGARGVGRAAAPGRRRARGEGRGGRAAGSVGAGRRPQLSRTSPALPGSGQHLNEGAGCGRTCRRLPRMNSCL